MEHNPSVSPGTREIGGLRFVALVALLALLPGLLAGSAVAVIVGVALAAVLLVYQRMTVVKPLNEIRQAGLRFRDGDESARAAVTAGSLAPLAADMNWILDERSELNQLRSQQDDGRARAARLLRQMTSVAGGDLSVEADASEGDLAPLAETFNLVVGELRTIINSVTQTSDAVGSASSDIAAASTAWTTLSDQQSRQMTDTSAVLDEMAVSIGQVSEDASLSADVVRKAHSNAQTSSEAVRETVLVMERIRREVEEAGKIVARLGESSQEIGAIVQFIAQIARQTNTLALNASIQAARAGEHGRGFAVVADEVRTLAERSSNATKQIGALVTTIQAETADAVAAMDTSSREVSAGVRVANQAGLAIGELDVVVVRLAELINSISSVSESHARAAVDISTSMRDVSTYSRSASDSTAQASESVRSLSDLAERLRQSVLSFKVTRQGGTAWAGDGDD